MTDVDKQFAIHKEVKEGYTSFSAEILKTVLLILTAFSVLLIALIKNEINAININPLITSNSFWVTLVLLVLSGISALVHRYFANNALANQADVLLKRERNYKDEGVLKRIIHNRDLDFTICKASLVVMSISFAFALIGLAIFIHTLIACMPKLLQG